MKGIAKSICGHNCVQLFVSEKGFLYVVFMTLKKLFPQALEEVAMEIGIRTTLIIDSSGKETSNEIKQFARECSMTLRILEKSTQWAYLTKNILDLLSKLSERILLNSMLHWSSS